MREACELRDRCDNQRLLRALWQPVRPALDGLAAIGHISKDALVLEACGELFAQSAEFARALRTAGVPWPAELCFLSLGDKSSISLDVSRAGSLARLIAHAAQPNCELQVWLVSGLPRVGVYARVPIAAGSMLTVDYSRIALGLGTDAASIPAWWCARRAAPRAIRRARRSRARPLTRAPRARSASAVAGRKS